MDLIVEVKERLSIFKNLYDSMRIVDSVNKKTISITDNKVQETNTFCYELCNRGEFCDNCISARAYLNKDTFMKIEYDKEKVLLMIAVPMEIEGNVFVVELIKDITKNGILLNKFTESSDLIQELISAVNDKVAKDDLTGIFNRRYINERLPVDINYCRESKTPLSVIMADIDFFKTVNDKYGHVNGDKILIDFSNLIQKSIRSNTDWVARYGGEEFLIVLNNTDLKNAYYVAEKIRKQLESITFKYDDVSINITASFGVYCVTDYDIEISHLLSIVDKNLYKAKSSGRNMTITNQEDLDATSDTYINSKKIKLSKLSKQIDELREILNEVCCTLDEDAPNGHRLHISQCLDELIVAYMKEMNSTS